MQSSKLMQLLGELTDEERTNLQQWVFCSLRGRTLGQEACTLLTFLRKHNYYLDKQWSRERVWRKLFPGQSFRDARMRKIMHELTQFVLDYLGMVHMMSNEQQLRQATMAVLHERGLEKHYRTLERQSEQFFTSGDQRDHNYHHQRMFLIQMQFEREEQSPRRAHLARLLHEQDYHLECYYLIQKLRNYGNSVGNRVFFAFEGEELQLPNGFLDRIAQGPWIEEVGVRVYWLIAQMLEHPDQESWFYQLKSLLYSSSHHFSPDEQDSLYIFLKNYCIAYQINQGKAHYFQELFEISRTLLEKGLTQRSGTIEPQAYKNIITVALHVQEFDWTEQFIREYTRYLPAEDRQNSLSYNLAKVFFHQGRYGQVIEQLREVAYADHTYALGSKLMLLKTYYETGEDRALDSLIDSFRIYLRRNRMISKEVRDQYRNVLRFVRKLFYLPPNAPEAIAKLRREIEDCDALADKPWIMSKVAELSAGSAKA